MIDVARNVYTRDHARCEKRRGRDVYVWTKRVFLNAKSSIELRKKCRGALTSSRFPHHQKRGEIIEYTPTFQGRQKMIKCVRSSRKDLAALERDRTKERESDRRLFSFRLVLFRSPESWGFRGVERSPARRRTSSSSSSSSSESDRISFFSFFFSLTARTVLTQFFSLFLPNVRNINRIRWVSSKI